MENMVILYSHIFQRNERLSVLVSYTHIWLSIIERRKKNIDPELIPKSNSEEIAKNVRNYNELPLQAVHDVLRVNMLTPNSR